MLKKLSGFYQKHKFKINACAIAVCTAVVLAVFYVCFMPTAYGKMQSEYLSDNYSVPTHEIKSGEQLTQCFSYDKPIYAMGFVIDTLNSASGGIMLEIYDTESNLLAEGTNLNATEMNGEKYSVIKLNKPAKAENGQYIAVITVQSENGALLYKSDVDVIEYSLTENNKLTPGTLAMLVSYSVINDVFVNGFFIFLAILVIAACAGTFYLFFAKSIRLERLFLICLFILAFFYNLILPPFSSPDEQFHINEAYRASNTILGMRDTRLDTTSYRAQDKNAIIDDSKTNFYTYSELANNTFSKGDSTILKEERILVGGLGAHYWASGLGIAIARILNVGYVPLLYFGRLANLLVYALCGYFAIKAIPFAKNLLFTILLLPITLHVGFSFSRDSIILSFSTLFICFCLEHISAKRILTWQRGLALLLSAMLISASKSGVYLPICLLVLLIPKECFKARLHSILSKAALLTLCASFLFITTIDIAVFNATTGASAQAPVQAVVSAQEGESAPSLEQLDTQTYNIDYILTHKRQTIMLTLNSITRNLHFYLSSMVGGSLGYFSIAINPILTMAIWILLIVFCANGPSAQLKAGYRFSFIGIFAAVSALVAGGCILWTPVHYETIYGLQGRYILPAFLLLGAALQSKKLIISKALETILLYSIVPLNLLVLLNALSVIATR